MPEEIIGATDTVKTEEEKTFTRDQLNRYIGVETKKAREDERNKVYAELKAEQEEVARVAALTEQEKAKEQIKVANDRAKKAESELNALRLRTETIANNPDLPAQLIGFIDFDKYNTTDKVTERLNELREAFSASVTNGINTALKEKTPAQQATQASPKPLSLEDALMDKLK